MKYIITALLSAALLLLIGTPVNNSAPVKAKAKTVQVVAPEKAIEVTQTPTEQKTDVEPATQPPIVEAAQPPTDHEQLMTQAGIDQNDWAAANYIIDHESSWREFATEPTSGAYGLCQSLPAIKMASAGSDWQTNPVTQLKWCNSYAQTRYGGWQGAYNHWTQFRWW
jgi:hypothetical protein